MTGTEDHYAWVAEDCDDVSMNYPELLYECTNFGEMNQSPQAASQYYWHTRNVVRHVQSGESLTAASDHVWWLEDVHIIAISLLYDIAIFSYSTVINKWFAFNTSKTSATGYQECCFEHTVH